MVEVLEPLEPPPLLVHTRPVLELDDEKLFQLCQINPEVRIERTAEGDLIFMTPEGGSSGCGNFVITGVLLQWARKDRTGKGFGSATGFTLPNGAMRSPDLAWVRKSRLQQLTPADWKRFLPLCPDFVVELRSPSDSLRALKAKMQEYVENGAQLGWLIDPAIKAVHIYRPDRAPEILADPAELSGESVLKGFTLKLEELWNEMEL
jgi:Uma2 family endonuclease